MVSASWKELRKIWSADGLPPLSIVRLASRGRPGALRSRPVAPPRRGQAPQPQSGGKPSALQTGWPAPGLWRQGNLFRWETDPEGRCFPAEKPGEAKRLRISHKESRMVSASWKELRKIWSADGLPPLSIVRLASRGRPGALRSRPVAPPRRGQALQPQSGGKPSALQTGWPASGLRRRGNLFRWETDPEGRRVPGEAKRLRISHKESRIVSASWKELRRIWSADGLPPLSIVRLASRGRPGALRSRPVAPPRRGQALQPRSGGKPSALQTGWPAPGLRRRGNLFRWETDPEGRRVPGEAERLRISHKESRMVSASWKELRRNWSADGLPPLSIVRLASRGRPGALRSRPVAPPRRGQALQPQSGGKPSALQTGWPAPGLWRGGNLFRWETDPEGRRVRCEADR